MQESGVIEPPAKGIEQAQVPHLLARIGALEVRLAAGPAETAAARRLRYEVFVEEMGADLASVDHARRLESDRYDPLCDHIIVCDTTLVGRDGGQTVVGAYRALRPEMARTGFYSQSEFDVEPLILRHSDLRFCEVGRSCVAPSHRSMRTIEALWYGLWAYACLNDIDVYFGAASFPGADPDAHGLALSYLHNCIGAPLDWQVDAHPGCAVPMDRVAATPADRHEAMRAMPPLIRGYLRVNAHVGTSAFFDRDFGTTDVMIVTRLARMPRAYRERFVRVTNRDLTAP